MALEGTANALAIEQYFSDEPQRVTVIDHQDRHEQATDHEEWQDGQRRQDQPTDQPTPR